MAKARSSVVSATYTVVLAVILWYAMRDLLVTGSRPGPKDDTYCTCWSHWRRDQSSARRRQHPMSSSSTSSCARRVRWRSGRLWSRWSSPLADNAPCSGPLQQLPSSPLPVAACPPGGYTSRGRPCRAPDREGRRLKKKNLKRHRLSTALPYCLDRGPSRISSMRAPQRVLVGPVAV